MHIGGSDRVHCGLQGRGDRARAAEGGRAREGGHDRAQYALRRPGDVPGTHPREGGGGAVRRSVRSHSPHFARSGMRRVPHRAVHGQRDGEGGLRHCRRLAVHHGPGDHGDAGHRAGGQRAHVRGGGHPREHGHAAPSRCAFHRRGCGLSGLRRYGSWPSGRPGRHRARDAGASGRARGPGRPARGLRAVWRSAVHDRDGADQRCLFASSRALRRIRFCSHSYAETIAPVFSSFLVFSF